MLSVTPRRWLRLFIGVTFLVLAQVSWWTVVFLQEVDTIVELREQNQALQSGSASYPLEKLRKEAFHRRVMFVSESFFFVLVTFGGLFLLYRGVVFEERARQMQRSFIETLTHESKTPLTALKLRLESIQEKWKEDLSLRRDLALALDEVGRLISVFEKTLQLNQVERHAYTFETFCLSDVVREVVHRLDPLFRTRSVAVTLEMDEDVLVCGDFNSLQNSVQSLLENAVFYNFKNPKRIEIRLEKKAPYTRLSIRDNGPGIDPKDRLRVFEKFYRGESAKRVPGTGLGLYLAKTIIEAHQGMLRLVSDPTEGSYFEIDLPQVT